MNKGIVLGIVILVVGMSFTGSTYCLSMSKSPKFSFDGNILYVGGNGSGNYTSIQDAIDNASDGDTVFVYDDSSPYYEWDILIDKSINLIGENRDTTVIDGNRHNHIVLDTGSINISGFSIINGWGIDTFGTLNESPNIIISDNHFINCSLPIELYDSDNSFVISNTFRGFQYAIWCEISDSITISNNILISSQEGDPDFGTIDVREGRNHVITNNTFLSENKKKYRMCLCLRFVSDSIIEGNEFNGYDWIAIHLLVMNENNIITHNNITNKAIGIALGLEFPPGWPRVFSNKIINNNFIGNEQDAFFRIYALNNYWDGNYWDKWIGVRYPLPIFQKFPKIIHGGLLGFGIDWHPAKEPYNITTAQGCGIE